MNKMWNTKLEKIIIGNEISASGELKYVDEEYYDRFNQSEKNTILKDIDNGEPIKTPYIMIDKFNRMSASPSITTRTMVDDNLGVSEIPVWIVRKR